jgi:hypothetical protein
VPKSEGYKEAGRGSITRTYIIRTSYQYYSVDQVKEGEIDMATITIRAVLMNGTCKQYCFLNT